MASENEVGSDPAKYREIADSLRRIARGVQYDVHRVDQLHALADGFDRLAMRLEREQLADAAAD